MEPVIILIIVLAITMPIVAGIAAFALVGKADAKYRYRVARSDARFRREADTEYRDRVARRDREFRRERDEKFAKINEDYDARMKAINRNRNR